MRPAPARTPLAAMPPRRQLPREQLLFTFVLALLAFLAAVLWFKDPAHRYSSKSRVDWPPPPPAKP